MMKSVLAMALAAGLLSAPLPSLTATAAAQYVQSAAPAEPAKAKTKTTKQPTPGQIAARERQKTCAAEWKAAKRDGKVEKGMTWPKYWSACNTRLKAGK